MYGEILLIKCNTSNLCLHVLIEIKQASEDAYHSFCSFFPPRVNLAQSLGPRGPTKYRYIGPDVAQGTVMNGQCHFVNQHTCSALLR